MGLFNTHTKCGYCGKETGLNKYMMRQMDTKYLCYSCFYILKKSTKELYFKLSKEDIIKILSEAKHQEELLKNFKTTQKSALLEYNQDKNTLKIDNSRVINVSDILSYEIIEDGNTVTSGGLGKAIATDLLINPVAGVLVGVTSKKKNKGICTKLEIKITLNDISNPCVYVQYIKKETKKNSLIYANKFEECQKDLSFLEILVNKNDVSNIKNIEKEDETDAIRKYKKLFDDGIISEHEFNLKKKELLNLG